MEGLDRVSHNFACMRDNNPENYNCMLKSVEKSKSMFDKCRYSNSMNDAEKVVYNIKWVIRKTGKYFENESSIGHTLISKTTSIYALVNSNKIASFSFISLVTYSIYTLVNGGISPYLYNSTKLFL